MILFLNGSISFQKNTIKIAHEKHILLKQHVLLTY